MHTHEDSSHSRAWISSLKEKMERMTAEKQNAIAGPEDIPLAAWKSKANGMYVRHMPDDEHGVVRVSVGGGDTTPVTLNYCTIRGTVGQSIKLLEMAIVALREAP